MDAKSRARMALPIGPGAFPLIQEICYLEHSIFLLPAERKTPAIQEWQRGRKLKKKSSQRATSQIKEQNHVRD